MKKLKIISILVILFTIYTLFCAYTYALNVSNNLSNKVFRLHVIANSDSIDDQNLKYIVRDNIIKYMNEVCENCTSKEEVIKIVSNHINDFENIAKTTIYNEGFSYPVKIELGNFEFPTKIYGDISFPSGYYDSLKIQIGNAQGKNWWCVLFPPLCFVDVTTGIVPVDSKEILEENLSSEEYKIISETENYSISFKFKVIEFFNEIGII